jgi:hypothetical protein
MKKIDNLLQREMSRKEFLSLVGLAIISVIGLPALLGLLGKEQIDGRPSPAGYGSGRYGR